VANSAALRMAGISATSADPASGTVVRLGDRNAVPSEGTVRATWVLAKRDGRWHVAAYHYSAAN
jgi:predicted amidohydrolase YtcJ